MSRVAQREAGTCGDAVPGRVRGADAELLLPHRLQVAADKELRLGDVTLPALRREHVDPAVNGGRDEGRGVVGVLDRSGTDLDLHVARGDRRRPRETAAFARRSGGLALSECPGLRATDRHAVEDRMAGRERIGVLGLGLSGQLRFQGLTLGFGPDQREPIGGCDAVLGGAGRRSSRRAHGGVPMRSRSQAPGLNSRIGPAFGHCQVIEPSGTASTSHSSRTDEHPSSPSNLSRDLSS